MNQLVSFPTRLRRGGLVLSSEGGSGVAGDPCIVRDDDVGGYRMVLFFDPAGHADSVCRSYVDVGPSQWSTPKPLRFSNPDAVNRGYTHKPFIVQNAYVPNQAAWVGGKFWLVSFCILRGSDAKYVHRASADSLAGPWTWEIQPLIVPGTAGAFDAKHVDAVSGYYFADRGEFLYFYMGYPRHGQSGVRSAFGSALGAATQHLDAAGVRRLGRVLPPSNVPGHWAGGYVGGFQLLPGREHKWVALLNASPTAPLLDDTSIAREEPPPSLGGFAFCDEEWPIDGWQYCAEPLEWIDAVPPEARAAGEGTNLWRHHLLCTPDGSKAIFYNSGSYGNERMFVKYVT